MDSGVPQRVSRPQLVDDGKSVRLKERRNTSKCVGAEVNVLGRKSLLAFWATLHLALSNAICLSSVMSSKKKARSQKRTFVD